MLDEESLGSLPGEYTMKMTLLEMEPGAAIPEHTHKGPGMRYVLEGAIAIAWKNGKTEIFKAGSTYFEAPGQRPGGRWRPNSWRFPSLDDGH